MTKRRILIVNNNMHIGGVQRALVNLLKCIQDRYDITLALFNPKGELMAEIPESVKVLPVKSAYRYLGMTRQEARKSPIDNMLRSFYALLTRIFGRNLAVALMAMGQSKLQGYDGAISYLHNASDKMFYGGCNDFVLRHVHASRKYTFLHCDYLNCGANTAKNRRQYKQFDMIAACSEGCRVAFVCAVPELADKTAVVWNCQDYDEISRMAVEEEVKLPEGRVNILTVARLGKEKGVPRAIEALQKLSASTASYHYYIIGDGAERAEIEQLIHAYGFENRVSLLGEKTNPYNYMKAADMLLMPSVNEAAPMVIGEAASLCTPILTTKTTSAIDMVENTGFGWVCENSVDGIADALQRILDHPETIRGKKEYLSSAAFDNTVAMSQFAVLLDGTLQEGKEESKTI